MQGITFFIDSLCLIVMYSIPDSIQQLNFVASKNVRHDTEHITRRIKSPSCVLLSINIRRERERERERNSSFNF